MVHRVLIEVDTVGRLDPVEVDVVVAALGAACRAVRDGSTSSRWLAELNIDADDPNQAMSAAHALVLRVCSEAGRWTWQITRVEWTRRRWYGSESKIMQRLTPGEPFSR